MYSNATRRFNIALGSLSQCYKSSPVIFATRECIKYRMCSNFHHKQIKVWVTSYVINV